MYLAVRINLAFTATGNSHAIILDHSVTCHRAEVLIPPLPLSVAGTRFNDPGEMRAELTYVTWKRTGWELNPRLVNRKSNALPQRLYTQHVCWPGSLMGAWVVTFCSSSYIYYDMGGVATITLLITSSMVTVSNIALFLFLGLLAAFCADCKALSQILILAQKCTMTASSAASWWVKLSYLSMRWALYYS